MFCTYCGTAFTDDALDEHMKICVLNEDSVAYKDIESQEALEKSVYIDMQNRVDSYQDIFTEIDKFLLSKGYTIRWTETPSEFVTDISNHHTVYNSSTVLIESDDGKYSGWMGNFKGTITSIGDEPKCSFWDLNGDMDGKFGMKFLRTSSGGWGNSFQGQGFLLVNDFPKLHRKMLRDIKSEQTTDSVNKEVQRIKKAIQTEENNIVHTDPLSLDIIAVMDKISKFNSTLSGVRSKRESTLRKTFQANVVVELPKITNPFINLSQYESFRKSFVNAEEPVVLSNVEIDDALVTIKQAVDLMDDFHKNNIEYFI